MHKQYQLYGRHKGHPLRANQARLVVELLPRLRVEPDKIAEEHPRNWFAPPAETVWLEIGFGGGEHLAWQARRNKNVGFIGCEPFINGIAKLLAEIEAHDLSNIRVLDGDARPLLERLPDDSISRIFLLYPDPWHKTRHHKRRFINPQTLHELHRVLAPDGELRIASDIAEYVRWVLLQVRRFGRFDWTAGSPNHWRCRPDDWPTTRYEQKAIRQGRTPCYLTFNPTI